MKLRHVLISLVLFAAIFYGLGRVYLFLISWDKLDIRTVEIIGARPEVKRVLDAAFRARPFGNILICDIERLRAAVRSFVWVKDVRIQKIFPSVLSVEIRERTPKAVIQKTGRVLVDEEGVELGAPGEDNTAGLPLLTDRNGFRTQRMEKLKLAWACLDGLHAEDRAELVSMDLSNFESIDIRFKDDPASVRLGDSNFGEKIRFYRDHRAEWEQGLGPLATIDLRFDDRVYITTEEPADTEKTPGSGEEAA